MSVVLRVGRYEALRPIASGGMATVYLGRAEGARGFERQVAIKAMHPHLADDPEFVTMFLDEARMAANIRHPNVVPTLDVAEENGQLFLIMEYVEGLSLQGVKRALKKQIVPVPIALRIALDMLAGLHAAHELTASDGTPMKLIHRDVSPHNVLVGVDGVSRIMDFGIARAEIRITSTRGAQVKGKTAYMAPEQIRAEPIDQRCDIYAAGIVTWELLTGERLFRADNEGSLVSLVLTGASRTPSQLNSTVTPAIDAVCMKALAPLADDRFATAAAFAEALEDAAGESAIAIATSRAVSAFMKALPPSPTRAAESMLTPNPASARASSSASAASQVSVVGPSSSPSQISPGTGTEARSAVSAELERAPELPPPTRGGSRRVLVAAVAASLVTGAAVWALTRSAPPPAEPPAVAVPIPSAAAPVAPVVPAATVEATAPPLPTATPSVSASSAPTSPRKPTAPGAFGPRGGKPSTGFRPAEP
jgi:serine/threonine-protein kinase